MVAEKLDEFERNVLATIKKHKMIEEGDYVLIAVSGGPDSTSLLYVLDALAPILKYSLHLFHLDHKIRGESSQEDALFVSALADKLRIPKSIFSFDVPAFARRKHLSLEEAGRLARYRLLSKTANELKATKIALGHQADDQIETFLMRLIRGTGTDGLVGIPPVRGKIIRPLIEMERIEIERYCRRKGISYRIDETNLSSSNLRSKIRYYLIPYLVAYNPNFKKNLSQTMEIISEEKDFLEEIAKRKQYQVVKEREGFYQISISPFKKLTKSIQRRILRNIIKALKEDLKGIEFKHIESILTAFSQPSSHFQIDLPSNLVAIGEYGNIIIARKDCLRKKIIQPIEIKVPGSVELSDLNISIHAKVKSAKDLSISKKSSKAYLDADKVKLPLILRSRLPGDRFVPLGMDKEKKLQDFLVDNKVPFRVRDQIPLVESNGEIVWVVGYRISEKFKVTDETSEVLILEAKEVKRGRSGKISR